MAEQKESGFKSRWIEKVESLKQQYTVKRTPSTSVFLTLVENHLKAESTQIVTAVVRRLVAARHDEQQIASAVENEINARKQILVRPNGDPLELMTAYGLMEKRLNEILDKRKQEQWSDTHDLIKLLVFRMLTAIGIALVVLGTATLAHFWKIPLPMIRAG